ncbi:hypothetical protein [Rhodococcus sp. IEGM1428]|uniref:hypothetical protein n=1 Tax=Rhodococcus sp. IEGM1428 TaxID=3392191 RepID=UPI003D0FCADD
MLLQTAVFEAAPNSREPATSLYVLVFNVSIAGGAAIGAVGVDVVGPTAPMAIGAAFCGLGLAVALSTRVGGIYRQC